MNRFRRSVYFLEFCLIRFLGGCINLLPLAVALKLAPPAGQLLFRILKRYRLRAVENLRNAFQGEKSEEEIQALAREAFVYLAEFAVEWLRMTRLAKNSGRYLAIEGVEKIGEARKKSAGAMLLVSHAGNWEIMALIGGLLIAPPLGTTIHALARPLKNPYLYEYILYLRGLTGLQNIRKVGAVKKTLKALMRNEVVCLLVDQRVNEGSVEAEFFGQGALTTSLPAIAAVRLGTPIFFSSLERTPEFRFIIHIEGPFSLETTGDTREDIRCYTQIFNDRMEEEIRKNPGHWLWMHNRWRVRHGAK